MEMHFATVWEAIADNIGDKTALVHGDARYTWTEYDTNAARIATALTEAGLKPDSKTALYLYNSPEYLTAQFGTFKTSGVPINVNYRYLDDELHYILDNADAEALFFHDALADRVARLLEHKPIPLKLLVQVPDIPGTPLQNPLPQAIPYSDLLANHDPAPRITRSEDEIYMLYTGGTTGMPKGVMYNMGAFCRANTTGLHALLGLSVSNVKEVGKAATDIHARGEGMVSIPACPLMHGTGMWLGAMMPHGTGGTVVTLPNRSFDPDELWQTMEREKATFLVIVGDAFAKPLLRALEAAKAQGKPYDLSSVKGMMSSGVMWTKEVKKGLLEHGDFMITDAMGATEGGMGIQITTRYNVDSETAKFALMDTAKVFTEDGREVVPGSGEIGLVASGANPPLGYWKDPEKSALTFKTINGKRYSFPGDWGTIEADGTLVLLGRGSQCINTGGEKVYPEEVEEAIKRHTSVRDCLVVGLPDEKFGNRVTALASLNPNTQATPDEIRSVLDGALARYKHPKNIHIVKQVHRTAQGKADYPWATKTAAELELS